MTLEQLVALGEREACKMPCYPEMTDEEKKEMVKGALEVLLDIRAEELTEDDRECLSAIAEGDYCEIVSYTEDAIDPSGYDAECPCCAYMDGLWDYFRDEVCGGEEHFDPDTRRKCGFCGEWYDGGEMRATDLGELCGDCICEIVSRGEKVMVAYN